MKVNLYAPHRHDPLAAIRLLADEEEDRERLAQARNAFYSKRPPRIFTPRMVAIVIAVFLLSFLFLNAWPAKADPLPNLIQITADVSWSFPLCCEFTLTSATETFHAQYQLENIGSQPQFIGDVFMDPLGGDYVLVPGSLSFSTTGPLGPFSLSSNNQNSFDWLDPAGNLIQTFWNEENIWKIPGTYLGGNVELWTAPGVAFPTRGEFFGTGTVVVDAVPTPEPATAALMCFALYLFALCLPKRSRRP